MSKLMIKELEDYPWFPALLRRFQTEIIGEIAARVQAYRSLRHYLEDMTSSHKITRIVDLCSGSGKPALAVHQSMTAVHVPLYCSDLYPQSLLPHPGYKILQQPVDVLSLSPEKGDLYTMYNAFHHFDDGQKKAIVQSMTQEKACFVFAEILQPGLFSLLQVLVASVFGTLAFTPFIRPFSWSRLVLTYILPVNLLTVLIDGILSVFRATSPKKLQALFEEEVQQGEVEILERFSFPVFVTILKSSY